MHGIGLVESEAQAVWILRMLPTVSGKKAVMGIGNSLPYTFYGNRQA